MILSIPWTKSLDILSSSSFPLSMAEISIEVWMHVFDFFFTEWR